MQQNKKQLEILLMYYFKESYGGFPKCSIAASESPDFILKLKNRYHLGVELTRLNPVNAIPPDSDKQLKINTQEHLIGIVKNLVENDIPNKLFVKFLFSVKSIIESKSELIVAVQTANVIREAIQNKTTESFFKISVPSSQLPEGIEEILLVQHPSLENSVWERSNNLGVSNNVLDDIRTAIHKKDEKLRIYRKQQLNYYWLLITTDRLRGVRNFNLPNKIINHKFQSQFQHVFLFDLIKSDVFQLV